jgi:hypothetical protein
MPTDEPVRKTQQFRARDSTIKPNRTAIKPKLPVTPVQAGVVSLKRKLEQDKPRQ